VEKLIYILVPIAYFLYQGYQNFLKEQEEAKKRNLQQPNQPEEEVFEPLEYQYEAVSDPNIPKEFNWKELRTENTPYRSVEYTNGRKMQVEERVRKENKKQRDYYNPEVPSAEVARSRMIHEKHGHGVVTKPLEIQEIETSDFDLRDAIIKEAILRRPYA
jgi:hypothetical protein